MLALSLDNVLHAPHKDLWKYGSHLGERRLCAEFDGTGDYVKADFFDDLEGGSEFTLSLWVKFDASPAATVALFQQGHELASDPPFMQIRLHSFGASKRMTIYDWFGSGSIHLMNASNHDPDMNSTDIVDRWMHFLVRWDKSVDSGKVQYMADNGGVNGNTLPLGAISGTSTNDIPAMNGTEAQQQAVIGAQFIEGIGVIASHDGKIADVALWSKRLDDEEVNMIGSGVSPVDIQADSLNHYWPLSKDLEDYGTATTRDEADLTAFGDASTGNAI